MNATPTPAVAKPSIVARLRSLPGLAFSLVKKFLGWVRQNPKLGIPVATLAVAAIIGMGVCTALIFSKETPLTTKPDLAMALERLDAGDDHQARQIAAQLRSDPNTAYEALGGPFFVLGAVMANDAQRHVNDHEQRMLFRIAARYLEESERYGFPPAREAEAKLLMGKCLYRAARYAQSAAALEDALLSNPLRAAEIHQLLADCYLRVSPPALDKALVHLRQLRRIKDLPEEDRSRGLLLEGQVLLAQDKLEDALSAMANIPKESNVSREAAVTAARIRLTQAQRDKATPTATYQQIIDNMRALQQGLPPTSDVTAQSQLMIGLAYRQIGDTEAALAQLARVRKLHYGRPESLFATVNEAEIAVERRQPLAATTLLERAMQDAPPADEFQSSWMSLPEFQARLEAMMKSLEAQTEFSAAESLATITLPLFKEEQTLSWRSQVRQNWANALAQKAETQDLADQAITLAEAREKRRLAAQDLTRLADLRITSNQYLEHLGAAAAACIAGQDYNTAATLYRRFLKEQSSKDDAAAWSGLGEALLASGNIPEALDALENCYLRQPKHPSAYRARLLAAMALEELGKLAESRQLLEENLYQFSLSPESPEWKKSLFTLSGVVFRQAIEAETNSRTAGVDETDPERKKAGLALLEESHTLFQDAIRILNEATQRYPDSAETLTARYRIAESYRHSAKWPRKRLGVVTIETTRIALNRQIQQELGLSIEQYIGIIESLSNGQESNHTEIQQKILRNAYFGRADALFDLGKYEQAIAAYSAATNRYQHEPESLEAYTQIAACYRLLSRPNEARGTLQQALVVLDRMRTDADFTRTTRFNRDEWREVLTWLASL
ncbi:Tetratricopeptide TPR_2 repeat protein [Pirellula staleyi DSM 6068]|uniref:Tetratricopeptide TPR_2 repeat protein n=1 Tax=Pirellula staleyi (strain ATCC 27377 / DSM 6068 / ICPB 4128) TaxID=530564 RepID=D2R518_PIRSD|nr:tetratricopeptide repeat protein [Pirellula staleyi]ADB18980.1 Tetratricopeptide TPR_2 repeat protein [Pirellula staleyi DSM 6068]